MTRWRIVFDGYKLEPLVGLKVYITNATFVFILASTGDSLPSLALNTGWNLVGPNPPFCHDDMDARDFVTSIVRTDGSGFSQLVSQGGSQENWSYTLGDWLKENNSSTYNDRDMTTGKAYWVWVNSNVTLAGFGFTPLGLLGLYSDSD